MSIAIADAVMLYSAYVTVSGATIDTTRPSSTNISHYSQSVLQSKAQVIYLDTQKAGETHVANQRNRNSSFTHCDPSRNPSTCP
jgi:serine protease inhibitor ecotin